jgi:hypothetical protein
VTVELGCKRHRRFWSKKTWIGGDRWVIYCRCGEVIGFETVEKWVGPRDGHHMRVVEQDWLRP